MSLIAELLAWVGTILLAVCSLPQVLTCCKSGKAEGISLSFLLMWATGCVSMTAYSLLAHLAFPLTFNYAINSFFALVILRYKFFPRGKQDGWNIN